MDDFGGKLRQARERRGISLRQIAGSTKIAAAALEALERNDVSKLPGGIFSRAFVRSYADEVGLDPDETVAEFLERFDGEPAAAADATAAAVPEEERAFQERQRQAQRAAIATALVLVLLVVGLVFSYRARAARHRAEQAAAQAAAAPSRAPSSAAPPAAGAQTHESDAAPPAAGQTRLDIQPTADCWVSVTADGRQFFARVIRAGESQSITFAQEAAVEIGDAGAFAYSINGKPGKSLGDKGQVRTLKLTPATASQFIH